MARASLRPCEHGWGALMSRGFGCAGLCVCVSVCGGPERDSLAAAIARRFFERSANSHKLLLWQGDAHEELLRLAGSASSMAATGVTDAADAADEHGSDHGMRVRRGGKGFDLVFLDAGKRDYAAQRKMLLQHELINIGGLVVADNVLWAGQVPRYCQALEQGDAAAAAAPASRQEKVTRALHEYVASSAEDPQWQQLVLPLRDGISVCRRLA